MNQSIYGAMKIHLRSGIVPDFGSSHAHPAEFGLNLLAGASLNPVFLKDQRNLRSFGSSDQWFCTSPAKSCPIWTRYAKDYLTSVRASSSLNGRGLRPAPISSMDGSNHKCHLLFRVTCACEPSVLSIPNNISLTVRDTTVIRIKRPSSFSF